MKTLDLSAVTPSVGIIPQKDTVEHITSSYLEGVASLAKSMIPTSWQTGKLVILHGCVATGTNPGARTLTAGAVFYNGEVYQVPSASFTTTGSQIGIWTLQDVNTGTESKLTDGSDVHVLINNKFVFAAGLSGTGDFDETSINIFNIPVLYTQNPDGIITRTVEIGNWDMSITDNISVNLSSFITNTLKIVSINCVVFKDEGKAINFESVDSTTFESQGCIGFINESTKVTALFRKTGGVFDTADYSAIGNRGYLTVKYLP